MARNESASVLTVGGIPRVDLMPPAELERRNRRALLRRWGVALLATALVTVLVIGGAFAMRTFAEGRLATERARTDALIAEIASLSDVGATVSALADLESYREEALRADLDWSPLFDSLEATLPEGVTVIGFDITAGAGAEAEDPASALGASVLITFAGPAPFDIVPAVRGVRQVPSVLFAEGSGARFDEGKSRYIAELTVGTDQDVYSGRFAPDDEED
jgi:hypothetical protein